MRTVDLPHSPFSALADCQEATLEQPAQTPELCGGEKGRTLRASLLPSQVARRRRSRPPPKTIDSSRLRGTRA
jgi:hypothetical protein